MNKVDLMGYRTILVYRFFEFTVLAIRNKQKLTSSVQKITNHLHSAIADKYSVYLGYCAPHQPELNSPQIRLN